MRYIVRKKYVGQIGKNNEIKRYDYYVYDKKDKKVVSEDFFYESFAKDFATDLNLKERFND